VSAERPCLPALHGSIRRCGALQQAAATHSDPAPPAPAHPPAGDDIIVRTLRVQDCATKASHTVTHYHYVSWPDFGAPSSPQPLLQLSRCLDQHRKPLGSPIVVHCKAGIGRSGTFCALDIASHRLRRLWRGRAQASDEGAAALVDVRALVLSLRQQRAGMVQTRLQYRLVYEAVARELGALLLQQASCM
jgi:protein tyrosine phosphatase